MRSVGIWIRVSTEDQARGESPEHHERRARAYAESKGWRVREVYRLEAVSGKSVREHPEAERMLGGVKSGRITALIFSKLARLARNTRELLDFADFFREHDADLISLQESIDTTTPAGRLFYTMIAGMAQWEREEISERVAASVPIRAQLGKPIGGAAPFGYRWENRRLAPDPNEVPVRRLLYELFLEHRRKKTVARILNERGHRTRNGSRFSDTTVDRLLRDPSAKGQRRANYTKSLGHKKHWKLKPREEWVFTPVPPVVSEELWDACNAILDAQREKGKRPARKAVHLFTGFVRCRCGAKMYVPWNSPKYVCYRCRNKVRTDDLETFFQEQLKGFLVSPDDIARHLAQADEDIKAKEERLTSLEAEQARIRQEMEKLYRLYQADGISTDGFARQNHPLEERRKSVEEELPRLQGEVDFQKIQLLSKDEILAEARDLYERWPTFSKEDRRQIIEAVLETITVGKEEIEIDLAYFPVRPQVKATPSTSPSTQITTVARRIHAPAAFTATRAGGARARPTRSRAPGRRSRGRSSTGST
ncbi:MAG TPA: recombinase family protein [Acidobacteriota bacterium]|nr:recombinase family protein [Acidobacteriota bacterium]